MQTNDESASNAKYPRNGIRHSSEYEREEQIAEIDENCEITDAELGLGSKYKRRSLDVLQAICDIDNVNLSTASKQAWKRYENQTATKRHRPCSRIMVQSLIRDSLQDLMIPWEQMESGGNFSSIQQTIGGNIYGPIKATRKNWWNEETISSWIKYPLKGWAVIAKESETLGKGKSCIDDPPMKGDSLSTLSSQFLDESYVKVRKCCSDDELLLGRENIRKSDVNIPKHEHSYHKALRRVQSRPALRNYNCDLTPLPTPKSYIDNGEVDLLASSASHFKENVGLGISGIKIPDLSKRKTVENSQSSVEERLVDRPPCLPEIFVDVSFGEGESIHGSSQNSPAEESNVLTTFSHLSYSSDTGTVAEKQDAVEVVKSSTPTSISSCESVRSLIQPFLDDDQCMSTLPSPANGEFSLIPAIFSIDGSKSFLKDFQKHIFDRTQKGNVKTQTIYKEINKHDMTIGTYPRQPQYNIHRHNKQQHPNHPFPWTTYNIWCYQCTKKSCFRCGNRCCVLTDLLNLLALSDSATATRENMSEAPTLPTGFKSPTSPASIKLRNTASAKKQAARALKTIMASHPTGGTDVMDMFLKCSTCEQTVCSMCCGVCPEGLCGDLQCKECKADPWAKCDWHW